MTNVELMDGGVYWVRPSGIKMVGEVITPFIHEKPILAQYDCADEQDGEEYAWFSYFGIDLFDKPEDVIVVAGPLEIPPPPEPEKEAEK